MEPGDLFQRFHIAPCGINCGTCKAYQRVRNRCSGCMSAQGPKVNHCMTCSIKNCKSLAKTASKFCSECEEFPCPKIRHIDKRYRNRYETSLILNLSLINKIGVQSYLNEESARWTCSNCGSLLCVHNNSCSECGKTYTDTLFQRNILIT
jgi:hypothetical protein